MRTPGMQNVRVIEFSSGVKSPPCCAYFPGEYLRPVDGRAEHILVSWLGKEAMAGVGLADSFNMVVMSFFAAIDLGTTVVVAFSPVSSIRSVPAKRPDSR